MTTENKRKTAKALAFAVILTSVAVIIGWIFDIPILKSISPAWITMKFSTAIAFFFSGVGLYFIVRAQEGQFDKAQVALSVTSLIIILLMGILFFSAFFKINTGIEDLFVKDSSDIVKTVIPGQPSVPTTISFLLIALAAILTTLKPEKLSSKLRLIGLIVVLIGIIAIVGYILDAPMFYYYIKDRNSAMACHTAILFILLGAGLCL